MIELTNLSAGYPGKPVLQQVCASFPKGRLTGVIGVNGCGKTTLLKAVLGQLTLQSGAVMLDGCPVDTLTRRQIARKVAYLAQGKQTPDILVEQLVLHGRFPHLHYPRQYTREDRAIAQQAMERAGVAEFAHLPMEALSGGMRQNAYIAMALAQQADYILLDEPTTYLDIPHQLSLMATLTELASSGVGIVAVMHDLSLAFSFCRQIVFLDEGKVIAQGTPEQLCACPRLREVFGVALVPSQNGPGYQYNFNPPL